jgi:hypothetical protein
MLSGRHSSSTVAKHLLLQVLDEARVKLNKTVFFGISDYWNTTICLFHKELNGPGPRPSEYVNARKGSTKAPLPPLEMELLSNGTRYDNVLYMEALEHFKQRAAKYDCPLVPSSG